jgi:hypothetical protein
VLCVADERSCVRQVTKNCILSTLNVVKKLEKDTKKKVSAETMHKALRKAGLGGID